MFRLFSFTINNRSRQQAAFTLIEVLVVLAIVGVLATTSVFNHGKFGKSVELENDAYNLALTIRQAQIYGVNKKSRDTGVLEFGESYSYGMYFNKTSNITAVDNKTFIIYVDGYRTNSTIDNKFTTAGSSNCTRNGNDECYSKVSLQKGNHISNIKVRSTTGWENVDSVDIRFKRPVPDAIIKSSGVSYSKARILVQDKYGEYEKCVEIGSAGDISIKNGC